MSLTSLDNVNTIGNREIAVPSKLAPIADRAGNDHWKLATGYLTPYDNGFELSGLGQASDASAMPQTINERTKLASATTENSPKTEKPYKAYYPEPPQPAPESAAPTLSEPPEECNDPRPELTPEEKEGLQFACAGPNLLPLQPR